MFPPCRFAKGPTGSPNAAVRLRCPCRCCSLGSTVPAKRLQPLGPAGGGEGGRRGGGAGAEQGQLLANCLENLSRSYLGGQWRHRAKATLGSSRWTLRKCSPAHLSTPLSPGALPPRSPFLFILSHGVTRNAPRLWLSECGPWTLLEMLAPGSKTPGWATTSPSGVRAVQACTREPLEGRFPLRSLAVRGAGQFSQPPSLVPGS